MDSNRVQPQPASKSSRHRHQKESKWMPKPRAASASIAGLEYLQQLDQVIIKQKVDLVELVSGIEMQNEYAVKNLLGQRVFVAKEKSDACQRQCCGSQRAFELSIHDRSGDEVMHITRPYTCNCFHQSCSCSSCCFDEVIVEAPPGRKIGLVRQVYGGCKALYHIINEHGSTALVINGPSYCKCYCPGDDIPFILSTVDGSSNVGRVSKKWSNLVQEVCTDADNFGITFPIDLDVKVKAVVIAACFLIDFMFFEQSTGKTKK